MKIPLTVTALLTFALSSTCQTVSLFDLIGSNVCPDPECFEGYMSANRFEFVEQEGNTYRYQSIDYLEAQPGMENRIFAQIQFYHRGQADAQVITSVTTANSDYHDALVREMDEYGYIVSRTEPTSDDATSVIFLSETYPSFELWVTMRYTEEHGEWMVYNFAMVRHVVSDGSEVVEEDTAEIDWQDIFQNISLVELMHQTLCEDYECFDEFAEEYGYEFDSKDEESSMYMTIGYVQTELEDIGDKNVLTLEFYPEYGETVASLTTPIPYYTDNLMLELAELHFVKVEDERVNDDGSVDVLYESPDYPEFQIIVSTWRDSFEAETYLQTDFIVSRFDE